MNVNWYSEILAEKNAKGAKIANCFFILKSSFAFFACLAAKIKTY